MFLFGKSHSLVSTDEWCGGGAAQDNPSVPCSRCVTVPERWICWGRFILTENYTTVQVCCQNRILMGGILLNQINKAA